jgi:ribulose bisphosphate carboxylase small subunit
MTYYIAPRFLDKLSVHITKNYLNLPNVKVPLILGVHGRKGEGKSFQCELVYERMGVNVVHMSAGELESPDAGDPARLIRLRYREAAELVKVRGKMAVLMINDIDAGAGRVDQFTQYTVNTQLVNATLMNIADNPTNVQLPGSYDAEAIQRIPIIVTGNDFSTLYAPMIRDGRMEKFYWEPDRTDRIGIVAGIFGGEGVTQTDVEKFVDTFPDQAIDFFGAVRSRLYDEQIRHLIQSVGIDKISARIVNSTQAPPEFHQPDFSLPHLIEMGNLLVREQQRIREMHLVQEYYESAQGNRHLGEVNLRELAATEPKRETGRTRPYAKDNARDTAKDNRDGVQHNGQGSNQTALETLDSKAASTVNSSNPAFNPASTQRVEGRSQLAPTLPVSIPSEISSEIHRLISQGYRVGIEVVDQRRFRTNSWQCYAVVEQDERKAIATIETCFQEHPNHYIRLVGIDPKDKHRILEIIIQRPST